jgi:hypothetical protein
LRFRLLIELGTMLRLCNSSTYLEANMFLSYIDPTQNSSLGTNRVCVCVSPCVVTGEKNSPTVAHACRKRRLKWVLPQVGG